MSNEKLATKTLRHEVTRREEINAISRKARKGAERRLI